MPGNQLWWEISVKIRVVISFAQFVYLLRKMCLSFHFSNDQIHNYVITVNFIIQKLKDKYTFLKSMQTEQS